MNTSLFQQLPHIYKGLLPDLFSKPIPVESYANCLDCQMCKPNTHAPHLKTFSKTSKCCTFKPIIPNYLIGHYLLGNQPSEPLNRHLSHQKQCTPLGFFPSKNELSAYAKMIPHRFGLDESSICDFLIDGQCSIWQYRNGICSTYHCHYVKGKNGKQFWNAIRDFLQFIETTLSQHCGYALGISTEYLNHNTTDFFTNVQLSSLPEHIDSNYSWKTNPKDFYIKCAQLVQDWTWEDVRHLSPSRYDILHDYLQHCMNQINHPQTPPYLIQNPACKIIPFDDTYSFFETTRLIKLPTIVHQLLGLFDRKTPNKTIIKTAKNTLNVDIDMAYIQHLYEQELLIE